MGFLRWLQGAFLLDKGQTYALREADERLEGYHRDDHAQRDEHKERSADLERYAVLDGLTIRSPNTVGQ